MAPQDQIITPNSRNSGEYLLVLRFSKSPTNCAKFFLTPNRTLLDQPRFGDTVRTIHPGLNSRSIPLGVECLLYWSLGVVIETIFPVGVKLRITLFAMASQRKLNSKACIITGAGSGFGEVWNARYRQNWQMLIDIHMKRIYLRNAVVMPYFMKQNAVVMPNTSPIGGYHAKEELVYCDGSKSFVNMVVVRSSILAIIAYIRRSPKDSLPSTDPTAFALNQ
ncbi:uncharacterized protein BDR25DRAFT_355744 [Lindgomyces ingoldianus]|uniref:Uncharacterized protein n=1 Tax=Lindgomyces ingoldianus TaxID=673940 RepID=A0ACB6QVA9_9PLEO|nr:uncharacterized protein BDR25DRAFT_355744 [Lindgomyces ingoldianus]KAF2470015.1 hypothetical protein BDR25DRAFT_355744 [Lindgomyces ingoldianus]